jgi:hypothetical protein
MLPKLERRFRTLEQTFRTVFSKHCIGAAQWAESPQVATLLCPPSCSLHSLFDEVSLLSHLFAPCDTSLGKWTNFETIYSNDVTPVAQSGVTRYSGNVRKMFLDWRVTHDCAMRDTSVEKLGHVWDCSIRRRVQSLSQRMEKPFETEGAGEGEISLIARVAPQAGLFGELKSTEACWSSFEKTAKKKKKAPRRGSNPLLTDYESVTLPIELRGACERLAWAPCWHLVRISQSMFFFFFFFFFVASLWEIRMIQAIRVWLCEG